MILGFVQKKGMLSCEMPDLSVAGKQIFCFQRIAILLFVESYLKGHTNLLKL